MPDPDYCAFTEKGLRQRNEDACLAVLVDGIYLFAVAEGIGGPERGESPAGVAVQALCTGVAGHAGSLEEVVESCLWIADAALFSMQEANPDCEPPAVAMTFAVVRPGGECVVSSSGNRKLFFLDQTQLDMDGIHSPEGAVGPGIHDPGAGMHEAVLPAGYLVLCSDGISDYLEDDRILSIVSERGEDLEDACRKMVYEAFQNGSDDNMTVVLVRQPG